MAVIKVETDIIANIREFNRMGCLLRPSKLTLSESVHWYWLCPSVMSKEKYINLPIFVVLQQWMTKLWKYNVMITRWLDLGMKGRINLQHFLDRFLFSELGYFRFSSGWAMCKFSVWSLHTLMSIIKQQNILLDMNSSSDFTSQASPSMRYYSGKLFSYIANQQ